MSSYNKQLSQVEERIEKYWKGKEVINAEQIVNDCYTLIGEVRELRATLKSSIDSLSDYVVFQNIVEENMSKDDFYKLLAQWQQKLSELRVAP